MNAEDFWSDQKHAQSVIRDTNTLKALLENYHQLENSLKELSLSVDELKDSFDPDLKELVDEEYNETMKLFD